MNYDFSLDKKKATVLLLSFSLLVSLIFFAGWFTGVVIRLPEAMLHRLWSAPEKDPPTPVVPQRTKPIIITKKIPPMPEPKPVEKPPEPAAPAPEPAKMAFSVQVGAFLDRQNAEKQVSRFKGKGYAPYIYQSADPKKRKWFVVRLGDFEDLEKASEAYYGFRRKEKTEAVITRIDSLSIVAPKRSGSVLPKAVKAPAPEKKTIESPSGKEQGKTETDRKERVDKVSEEEEEESAADETDSGGKDGDTESEKKEDVSENQ